MTDLERVIVEIQKARRYSLDLIESIADADYFRMPAPPFSHIGWQVGHLAVAEYYLVLNRVRGSKPEDEQIITSNYFKLFGKATTPQADAALYPTPAELRATLDRVHQACLAELPTFASLDLSAPCGETHKVMKTKLDALYWCVGHEMMHAGQIGSLRRLFGAGPLW